MVVHNHIMAKMFQYFRQIAGIVAQNTVEIAGASNPGGRNIEDVAFIVS